MSDITLGTAVGYALGILIICISARIFLAPIKLIFRLIINSALAVGMLFLINLAGPLINVYIGINPVSALVVGLLGIPGLCVLMLLQIFF